jgi:peptide/nickel transport system permease protein
MVMQRFVSNPASTAALFMLIVIALLSFGAPWIAADILHTSPTDQNILNSLAPWFSEIHLWGTDVLGRDVLTRVLFAGQISLEIGLFVGLLQLTIGIILGVIAGYYGGIADDLINILLQTVRSIPSLFLLIALSSMFRPTLVSLVLIISALGWTGTCRQIRGLVLSLKQRNFIEASRALGASGVMIFVRHLLPNVSSIALVIASFDIAGAIMTESSMSFLGFGIQPPTPSWGNMLNDALDHVTAAPWLIVIPGAFIMVTVLSVFLIADGIRDALDPQIYP